MKKIITFILLMLFFNIEVNAASLCTYQEQSTINSKAANVKASYEISSINHGNEEVGHKEHFFTISITNVTEDFYIVIKNDLNNEEVTYKSSDAVDGIITIKWTDVLEVTNLTIQVYTTNKTSCPNERYKTFYLTLPRYNEFSGKSSCVENPDFYLCKEFVTFDEIDETEFIDRMIQYKEKGTATEEKPPVVQEEQTFMDKVFEFVDTYKYILVGGAVLVIISIAIIHRVKTKKQMELGL